MSTTLIPCLADGGKKPVPLELAMATRHGLVTGATGTGKTVTLQALAEGFSKAGVPVFCCDVKGDLSGLGAAGSPGAKIASAFSKLGLPEPAWSGCPVDFWDVSGAKGHPLRATVSDLGPLLLGRLLGLGDVQADTLRLLFRVADERGLPVLDLADLRALVEWAGANSQALKAEYGLMSPATLGAIQRSVLVLDDSGAGEFFGEPALEISDLLRVGPDGRGVVSVLAADSLMSEPSLYAAVLLHLLGEVFEELPEAGDLDKPKLVMFLDEAHLLFDGAPKALVDAVERTARLVRSKGVGLWLVTQSPLDVPESVLGQLGNRVHHALRAYTPKEMKAVEAVAKTLRPNPKVDAAAALVELGVGEVLVSFLDDEGRPAPVERAKVVPPASRVGPLESTERAAAMSGSPMARTYGKAIDRASAYEMLKGRMAPGAGARAGARGGDEAEYVEAPGRSGASAGGAASGYAAGAGQAREPTIEEIEAELRGYPMRSGNGSEAGAPEPYFGAGAGAGGYEAAARGSGAGRSVQGERGLAGGRGAARATASRAGAQYGAGGAALGGGLAAELAMLALTAAGRELGRQAARGLLGTRRRKR